MISKKLAPLIVMTALTVAPASQAAAVPTQAPARTSQPAVQGLPLCTTMTSIRGVGLVPAASSDRTSCLIGDGLVGCSDCWAIRVLQYSMNLCYGESLDTDGYWGPLTREALKRTQRKVGTTADGIYGPNTRDRMRHAPDCPPR